MAIKAIFSAGVDTLTVSGLHQWDYGQKLEIHGLGLPAMIEVHFACLNMAEAHVRIGTTADGVTTVAIPDGCLEHDTPLRAWVYVVDATSGRTERTIMLPIAARTKPQGAESRPPFVADEYAETLEQINTTVDNWRDGIVDQNDKGKTKVWTGTREEFKALGQTDPRTMYIITDELPDYTAVVEYLEKVQAGDTSVPKATQAHYSMDGHSLNEMGALCDYVKDVQNCDAEVPQAGQAGQAHYDMSGRPLSKMGYFGDTFKPVTQLTEEGVYQIVATNTTDATEPRSECYFPLVIWRADGNSRVVAGHGGRNLVLYESGILNLTADTGSGADTYFKYFYARKISSITGW